MESSDESEQTVRRGKTYEHAEYGEVKVMGIWKGVHRVDEARNMEENDMIIVRHLTEREDVGIDEHTEKLDEFVEAIE